MSSPPLPSSRHDWTLHDFGARGQYDVDIDIRGAGGSMIEVHVRNLATGRRSVKMFDVYHHCNLGPFGAHGMLSGLGAGPADQGPIENESVSKKLLKLFL